MVTHETQQTFDRACSQGAFRHTIGICFAVAAGCLLVPIALAQPHGSAIYHTQLTEGHAPLGEHEALRIYVEFADGKDRGMYDPATGDKGYPDEDYDATTAMVVNWHRAPEADPQFDARLRFRRVYPSESTWFTAQGRSQPFWERNERVNRVVLTHLEPNAIYECQVTEQGERFRWRTMPATLEQRPVKIVFTADHQEPAWPYPAHENARMAALQKPDMFVVGGDFVETGGEIGEEEAAAWALYLDNLYGVGKGHFFYDVQIGETHYENMIIPHVAVVGNKEIGGQLMHPRDVNTSSGDGKYPDFTAPNWLELMFHFPFSSEGFYGEVRPDHPNMDSDQLVPGFNKGGYGALSFGDYLLLIALNNMQDWEGPAPSGLRDWQGHLITDKWPWYDQIQADFRQDKWLQSALERQPYTHVIPVYHRGLFGGARLNMSHKNRDILGYWLPLFAEHGVKLIHEGHDHVYTRSVPFTVTDHQPEHTYMKHVPYHPLSWPLTDNLSEDYLTRFYTVNCIVDKDSDEIVGWEYNGVYATYDPKGMMVRGHGGWAAGRRDVGQRQAGNAGWWFVDPEKGGQVFGDDSHHMTTVHLSDQALTIESYHPDQLPAFESASDTQPIHRSKWLRTEQQWKAYDFARGEWIDYEHACSSAEARVDLPIVDLEATEAEPESSQSDEPIPQAVYAAIERVFADAEDLEIERDDDIYEVEGETRDDREFQLEITPEGTLEEKSVEVDLSEVPASVRDTIRQAVTDHGGEFGELGELIRNQEDGDVVYEALIRVPLTVEAWRKGRPGGELELQITPEGTILEKEWD